MKSSTAAALILCTGAVCLTVLVCTGHEDAAGVALLVVLYLFFFYCA